MSDAGTGTRRETRVATPLSFTMRESRGLYIDQLEDYLAGIQALVALFSAEGRRGSRTHRAYTTALETTHSYRVTSYQLPGGGTGRVTRRLVPSRRRIRIRAISYNSPLEIIVEIPIPLLMTGGVGAVVGSGMALLKFWERYTKARVAHHEGKAAISKAKTEELAWEALREQLTLPREVEQLPARQRQQVKQAIKLVTTLDNIRAIEK